MFHELPAGFADRMAHLERLDAEERRQGLPAAERICAVPPETGKLLAILAAAAPPGELAELGTSSGYSSLWLVLAARQRGQKLHSCERAAFKIDLAAETFALTGVGDDVILHRGDADDMLARIGTIGFCFMDHDKRQYQACYERVLTKMADGALLAADNVVSHGEALAGFVEHVLHDRRVDAVVVPIGKGVLVARKKLVRPTTVQ
jgi:predicted O-methyltransferase YrrM